MNDIKPRAFTVDMTPKIGQAQYGRWYLQLCHQFQVNDHAYLVFEDGSKKVLHDTNGKISLAEVRKSLGCSTVQVVGLQQAPGDTPLVMLLDEDGLLKPELNVNVLASSIWQALNLGTCPTPVVGKVVICPSAMFE